MKKMLMVLLTVVLLCMPISASAMVVDSLGESASAVVTKVKNFDDLNALSDENVRMVLFEASIKDEIVPVKIQKKGSIEILLSYYSDEEYGHLQVELFSNKSCTKKLGTALISYEDDSEPSNESYYIPEAGTYYMKFSRNKFTNAGIGAFGILLFDGSNKTLTNKKEVISYSDSNNKDIYYKIVAPKDGYITTTNSFNTSSGFANITLMNSKKKAISEELYVSSTNQYTTCHAVKKGTYYIKVSSRAGIYSMEYQFTGVTDKGGASKATATTVKKGGSAVKGMIAATDKVSNADWYKVTLSKKQKVSFEITGNCSGRITMEVIPASGGTITGNKISIYPPSDGSVLESKGTWTKGTYYIKVSKKDAKVSGAYTLKVK